MRSLMFVLALAFAAPVSGQAGTTIYGVGTHYGSRSQHEYPFPPCYFGPVWIDLIVFGGVDGRGLREGPSQQLGTFYRVRILDEFARNKIDCGKAMFLIVSGFEKRNVLWPSSVTGTTGAIQLNDMSFISIPTEVRLGEDSGWDFDFWIPEDPSLIGLQIHHQGLLVVEGYQGITIHSTGGVTITVEE